MNIDRITFIQNFGDTVHSNNMVILEANKVYTENDINKMKKQMNADYDLSLIINIGTMAYITYKYSNGVRLVKNMQTMGNFVEVVKLSNIKQFSIGLIDQ